MSAATVSHVHCRKCGTDLPTGSNAWAYEVTVIEPDAVRRVTRYLCHTCHEEDS